MVKNISKKSNKDVEKYMIPKEIVDVEHNRCNAWNGDEEGCKANDCWYYRNTKRCTAHKGKLAEKLKASKKKRKTRRSRRRSKRSRTKR